MYVVSEFLEGDTWDVAKLARLTEIEKLHLALALIRSVMGLHSLNLAHGDIQPDNLLVDIQINADTGLSVVVNLIDIADFSENADVYNTEYGPKNPSVTDAYGRDRVACYLLIKALFGQCPPEEINAELDRGLGDNISVPPSIEPLENAIQFALTARERHEEDEEITPQIDLAWGNKYFPDAKKVLEQDEGRYLFNCKWDERRHNTLNCYITGISSQLTIALKLSEDERKVDRISLKNHVPLSEVVRASNQVQQDISAKISVRYGSLDEQTEKQVIDLILSFDVVLALLAERFGSSTTDQPASEHDTDSIDPSRLWSALIESEEKILQTIEVDSGEILENARGNLLIPYNSQSQNLDFEEDEEIFVSELGGGSHLGELVVTETNREILSLHPRRNYVRKTLKSGMILQLESLRNKASRDRRSKALARVVNNEAIIGNLPDYFDVSAGTRSQDYLEPPDPAELREIYDTDAFSMNDRQIEAFQHLISSGPIGVLQGPPGTGKTAFTSKFIHYLFAKTGVQNILLVGQSHTAVDNVAIKAREVCHAQNIELDIVRIGQEQMIDEELLHAHPSSLQRQLRHKFHREYDQRISSLSRHLLLPQDLVVELCFLHRTLASLIQNRNHLVSIVEESAVSGSGVIDVSDDAHKIKSLEEKILTILNSHFSGEFAFEFDSSHSVWDEVSVYVARQHGVNNPSAVSRLNQLLRLSEDWMDVLYTGEANYDRFLVNTRQLVCGTLVGMGLKRLEIETKIFDWVIVDEAGRAQASELMVALQCARRILLVGDHKQLPPHYDKAQLKLAANKLGTTVDVFDQSDFHRAFEINDGITLDTQYRMVKPIGDLVSTCFYAEEIESLKTGRGASPSWYSQLPSPLQKPVCWVDSSSSFNEIGEEEKEKGKFINVTEMELTLRILQNLGTAPQEILQALRNTVSNSQPFPIGIITMYSAQKELLENEISKSEVISPIRGLIKIDTVDSYQGQENKIVILSLVRDNRKKLQGFLKDSPRINVAISRAQERLVIIGAANMWEKGNTDSSLSKVLGGVRTMAQKEPDSYALLSGDSLIGTGV